MLFTAVYDDEIRQALGLPDCVRQAREAAEAMRASLERLGIARAGRITSAALARPALT